MNKFTMPVTAADVARERREGETMWQTKERLEKEGKRKYLLQAWMPDFEAVRDKRMSELTGAQKGDAYELWLREQMDHMAPYYQEHLLFLLERIDAVREAAYAVTQTPRNAPEGWQLVPDRSSDAWAAALMQLQPIRLNAAMQGIRAVLATAPKHTAESK